MPTKSGADMGYHTHYVVDGGTARIILMALVTPSEVMDNQPMLDLLWRVRFHYEADRDVYTCPAGADSPAYHRVCSCPPAAE